MSPPTSYTPHSVGCGCGGGGVGRYDVETDDDRTHIYHYNYVKIDYEAISTLQMLPPIERLPLLDAAYCVCVWGGGGGGVKIMLYIVPLLIALNS